MKKVQDKDAKKPSLRRRVKMSSLGEVLSSHGDHTVARLAQPRILSKHRTDTMVNAGLAGAASDVVSRYGSGIKEHLVAYGGVDNETGFKMHRSLKDFAGTKISADPTKDPKGYNAQLRGKAGYTAEVIEVRRQRAEQAISGKKPKTVRTDDTFKPDGTRNVNHELFDITTKVDSHGNPVPGCSAQMKFRGSDPKGCLDILAGKSCKKYVDNNCKLMVPKDYYDGVKEEIAKKIKDLKKQIAHLEKTGDPKVLAARKAELEKYKKINKNLRRSSVTNSEAQEGYLSPGLSTAKDVLSVAHRAGVEQAKMGAAIGGVVSIVRNAVGYFGGDKEGKDALIDVAKDTACAASVSYATGFTGSAIKGALQNAKSKFVRALSKTNLPAFIANTALEAGKTLSKFFQGKIDTSQCLDELGEKGFGMVNSALYAGVGQALIPIPVVGAMAGSMIGYALSSASYKILSDSLRAAKIAHEQRIVIEEQCAASIKLLRQFRCELEESIERDLRKKRKFFDDTFSEIKVALQIGDIDGYISATNKITESFGAKPLFKNMDEFDRLMRSDCPVIL